MSGLVTGIVAVGIAAGSTAASFIQAGKQKKAQAKADRAAAEAIDEAKRRLSVNFLDAMSIKKEPYELMRESLLSQGAQITEAAKESERGSAAAAGRIYAAQTKAQEGVRSSMATELNTIENAQLAEDGRLRDEMVTLNKAEASGAQIASAQAQNASNAATAQGIQGIANTAQAATNLIPLYGKNKVIDEKTTVQVRPPTTPDVFGNAINVPYSDQSQYSWNDQNKTQFSQNYLPPSMQIDPFAIK